MSNQIRQFDRVYVVCNDKGKPISDPVTTMEEAERCQADLDLTNELEVELTNVVFDWIERKAEALGRDRKEIYGLVLEWRVGDYGVGPVDGI